MARRVRTEHETKLEWVPVADIGIEPRAQCPFNPARAQEIAQNFDPDALGYPYVHAAPKRGGGWTFNAIDGQHRIAAVKIALGEDQRIECEVVRGITIERAAQLFILRNKRRNPRPLDLFRAAVTAKNVAETAINNVAEGLNLHIQTGTQDGSVSCVVALLALYKLEQRGKGMPTNLVEQTLALAKKSWGRRWDAFNGDLMRGVGMVLHRYGDEIEARSLTPKLASLPGGPPGLLGRGRSYREAHGGSTAHGVARALVAIYNKGRRSRQLAPWGEV